MVNIKVRLITFFVAKDGEAVLRTAKTELEMTAAQVISFSQQNSTKESGENHKASQVQIKSNPL